MLHALRDQYTHQQLKAYFQAAHELPFLAFFTQIFVSWGKEYFVVDLNNLKIIEQNYLVEASNVSSILMDEYNWSEHKSQGKQLSIKIGDAELLLKNFTNKEVRTGLSFVPGKDMSNLTGALVRPYYINDIKLDELDGVTTIALEKARIPTRTIQEQFHNSKSTQVVELPVF